MRIAFHSIPSSEIHFHSVIYISNIPHPLTACQHKCSKWSFFVLSGQFFSVLSIFVINILHYFLGWQKGSNSFRNPTLSHFSENHFFPTCAAITATTMAYKAYRLILTAIGSETILFPANIKTTINIAAERRIIILCFPLTSIISPFPYISIGYWLYFILSFLYQ